jgi:NitT/TauT family transport system permease protein
MSTYSVSDVVALAQSAEEGAAIKGRPLSLPISFAAGWTGVFASLARLRTLMLVVGGYRRLVANP